ncbi:hypothetical protein SCLCIDRAFT_21610 [Scleroderma citrinum Foug A]|uniref:Uncharacterized protein n=1 Tax=Scleroderma citrinum Foug A TaxID=1036808 RepID=A0A0C2ZZI9_9AGAM|nr:hypothetical protein SCLCIDRAFT_21610 [Scleroderma citrinum Foug A]
MLMDEEISVTKVHSKAERKALSDSEQPVVIGAPPPADSGHEKAQQMYVNGAIDHDGPPHLPPSKAAMRIKRGVAHKVKATEDDPIIISSSNDSTPIFCTTKSKAVPRKKKAKYILVSDSREDEAAVNVNERAVDVGLVGEADTYEEPGSSLKRKAKELQTMHPVKKSACTPELKPEKMASKKGKQHALGHVLRNAEDSSAESDFPDILMPRATCGLHYRVQSMDLDHSNGTNTTHSDPFLVLTMAEDPKVLSNEVPGVLKVPNGPQVPLAGLDPSFPSPKCCEPCRPLTESLQQEKDSPMSGKPNIVPALAPVSPTSATAVGPLPPKPTIGSQEEAMLLYSGVVGGQHGHSEWMDPSHQVSGGYLFHPPGQYLPYQGGDQGLMPLP